MEPFKLRAWTISDIPALAKFLNNKKIWDNCRDVLPYPYTERDAELLYEEFTYIRQVEIVLTR